MDLGLVTYLAANGADINIMDEVRSADLSRKRVLVAWATHMFFLGVQKGQPLIHVAVQLRSLKALQCLVTYGADIDATNKVG
jgi:hypothetical protein